MTVPQISDPMGQYGDSLLLLARAQRHHAMATQVNAVLAHAYLRRAAELRLAAWAIAARSAPLDIDDVLHTVAA
jgi:hypothetical protein